MPLAALSWTGDPRGAGAESETMMQADKDGGELEQLAYAMMEVALRLLDRAGEGASLTACHLQHAIDVSPLRSAVAT